MNMCNNVKLVQFYRKELELAKKLGQSIKAKTFIKWARENNHPLIAKEAANGNVLIKMKDGDTWMGLSNWVENYVNRCSQKAYEECQRLIQLAGDDEFERMVNSVRANRRYEVLKTYSQTTPVEVTKTEATPKVVEEPKDELPKPQAEEQVQRKVVDPPTTKPEAADTWRRGPRTKGPKATQADIDSMLNGN